YGVVAACDPVTVAVPDRNRLSTPARQHQCSWTGRAPPLVKGRVRVRVPPLALDLLLARPSGGDWGSELRSSWLDTSTGCLIRPAMLDRPGTALVTRTKWVRVPPPAPVSRRRRTGRFRRSAATRPRRRFDSCRRLSYSGVAQMVRASPRKGEGRWLDP